jgi:hypothetical protein
MNRKPKNLPGVRIRPRPTDPPKDKRLRPLLRAGR